VPAGNLINRLVGVVLVTPFLHPIANALQALQPDMAKMTAEFQLGFSAFMSGNVNEARKLISEKAALRAAELAAAERHLERLREGRPETLETTSLHLDVLRDLKRIHSHICSVAYPVLEAAGEMPAANVAESDPTTVAQGAKPGSDK
jgi:phosphate:Na+ symporter